MRAHHIVTPKVIIVPANARLTDAVRLMLENSNSGLPVVDSKGDLAGIVTERDFLRRQEIGTRRKRP